MATKIWNGSTDGNWNTAANWTPSGRPATGTPGDHIVIPAGAPKLDTNLDQMDYRLASFTVMPGFTNTIGSETEPLLLDVNRFEFAGTGISYVGTKTDTSANVDPFLVHNTATVANESGYGLYVIQAAGTGGSGTGINDLIILKGSVALCPFAGYTFESPLYSLVIGHKGAANTDVRVFLGDDAANFNSVKVAAGKLHIQNNSINVLYQSGGEVTTGGAGTVTTWELYDGVAYPQSSGTITTLNQYGGDIDFSRNLIARTVTNWNMFAGSTGIYNQDVVTLTNQIDPGDSADTLDSPGTIEVAIRNA